MPRNDDQINPTMVVDAIKAGSVKTRIMHDYKITDEELAMILLPQYRKGRLSKQEFNDFFKGLPVKRELQTPLELLTGEARLEDLQPPQDDNQVFDTPHAQVESPSESEVASSEIMPDSEINRKPAQSGGGKAAAQTRAILDRIFNKLDSIENRLTKIEDKLKAN